MRTNHYMDVIVQRLKGKVPALFFTLLSLFVSNLTVADASDKRVVFVMAKETQAYSDFISAFTRELGAEAKVHIVSDSTHREPIQRANLIITLGAEAAREMTDAPAGVPTLNTLVTRTDINRLKANHRIGVNSTVLYIDQPVQRVLALIKVGLPARTRITVALGPVSMMLRPDIESGCRQEGLLCDVMVVEGESGIDEALTQAERYGKVLLVLPDSNVVNSLTARNLILGAYRRGVALIGYSRALVKAGALMAVYSTPSQLGQDAAKVAGRLLAGSKPPNLQSPGHYPNHYSVSVNYQLARALRLTLDTEQTLLRAIHRVERND
jgi:ABC-type uncharacterized transport system substrate-binding protein